MKTVLSLPLLFSLLLSSSAQAKIYIDITRTSERSFPMALVPLHLQAGQADTKSVGKKFLQTASKRTRTCLPAAQQSIKEVILPEFATVSDEIRKEINFVASAVTYVIRRPYLEW